MEREIKNITKAIIDVMKDVKNIEKNSNVGSGKNQYKAVRDVDVKEVLQPAMVKHGLCIVTTDIQQESKVDSWEEKTQYGPKRKQSVFTKVKTQYLLMHTSGESIELCGYGHGVDSQDKSAGKATTYALKNCLLYTFMIPVGNIDDTDNNHSDEIPQKQAPKNTPSPSQKKELPWLSPGDKEWIGGIEKNTKIETMLNFFKITEVNQKEYTNLLTKKTK